MIMSTVSDTVTEIHRAVPAGEWDNRLGQRRNAEPEGRSHSEEKTFHVSYCFMLSVLHIIYPFSCQFPNDGGSCSLPHFPEREAEVLNSIFAPEQMSSQSIQAFS